IERLPRAPEAAQASAVDTHAIAVHLHAHSEPIEAFERAPAILGGGEMLDLAPALGQRCQDGIAVRNGLVAGDFNPTLDRARRLDGLLGHGGIWRLFT